MWVYGAIVKNMHSNAPSQYDSSAKEAKNNIHKTIYSICNSKQIEYNFIDNTRKLMGNKDW